MPRVAKNPGAGPGRPKGSVNRVSADVKAAILEALSTAHPEGAAGYLRNLAATNSSAFASLVGKIIPLTLAGDPENPLNVKASLADDDRAILNRFLNQSTKEPK